MKFEYETKQISLKINSTAKHLDRASFQDEAEVLFYALYKRNLENFVSIYHAIEKIAKKKKIDTKTMDRLIREIGDG